MKRRDFYVRDFTQKHIEALKAGRELINLIYHHDPKWQEINPLFDEALEMIERCWLARELITTRRHGIFDISRSSYNTLGTTSMYAHCAKKPCPQCRGLGWVVDEEKERKQIQREKERVLGGINKEVAK